MKARKRERVASIQSAKTDMPDSMTYNHMKRDENWSVITKELDVMHELTLATMVFCLPTLSANIPIPILDTLFTALLTASNKLPVELE